MAGSGGGSRAPSDQEEAQKAADLEAFKRELPAIYYTEMYIIPAIGLLLRGTWLLAVIAFIAFACYVNPEAAMLGLLIGSLR